MLPSVFCPLFVGIMSRFSISFVQDANDIIDIIIVAEILDCFMFLMVDTLVNFINKKILIVIKGIMHLLLDRCKTLFSGYFLGMVIVSRKGFTS